MENGHHSLPPNYPWVTLRLGRRQHDSILAVNFEKNQIFVKHGTIGIDGGIALETIDPGPKGDFPGVILLQTGWRRMYFLNDRGKEWKYDHYFDLAKRLIWKRGITIP